ncbi:hypothetical protein BHE74_00009630 [Ensete ventricosum]|nr:hypothetical protein BHE74_00009630 [Ensete ventricosum]
MRDEGVRQRWLVLFFLFVKPADTGRGIAPPTHAGSNDTRILYLPCSATHVPSGRPCGTCSGHTSPLGSQHGSKRRVVGQPPTCLVMTLEPTAESTVAWCGR